MIAANQTPESQHRTPISLYRNRLYSAQLGRFVTRDPIGYDGGLNLYEYVRGNPTNSLDASGLLTVFNFLGRGKFSGGVSLFDAKLGTIPTKRSGATLLLKFAPDTTKFGTAACPRCEEIGFIQVIRKFTLQYDHPLFGLGTYPWLIPGGGTPPKVDGEIPYQFASPPGSGKHRGDPLRVGAIAISDTPNAQVNTVFGRLHRFTNDFETCAVCLKGVEGPVTFDVSNRAADRFLVVYGCVTWGFSRDPARGRNLIWMQGGGGQINQAGINQAPGLPPSTIWKRAVAKHSLFAGPLQG